VFVACTQRVRIGFRVVRFQGHRVARFRGSGVWGYMGSGVQGVQMQGFGVEGGIRLESSPLEFLSGYYS
jgi:hypothetical protein